ncbi:hypothetical protein [Azotobacter vinelandii]
MARQTSGQATGGMSGMMAGSVGGPIGAVIGAGLGALFGGSGQKALGASERIYLVRTDSGELILPSPRGHRFKHSSGPRRLPD